tara:strand:- start:813 stop:1562 length:750 start_codon:yes stop_codon:yes gene_type:complete
MNLKMKFKTLILILFITSCSTNYTKLDNRKPYNVKGLAYIFNNKDYENKLIKGKLKNDLLQISHQDLKLGTMIRLINPKTKDSIVLKNLKKIKYPEFYKILITKEVASKLNIDENLPLVEVLEIRKNKSFVAEKAKIFNEEKKLPVNAPVATVKIDNISKKKNNKKKIQQNNIFILVGSFYLESSAEFLKGRIIKEISDYDRKKLIIKRKNSKEIEVISGPYKSVNLLKNDYIKLKKIGFEEMDIFIND